ncbi:hypothetical protein V8F20_006426 [Naviculisporaceae sp. PSN 640]
MIMGLIVMDSLRPHQLAAAPSLPAQSTTTEASPSAFRTLLLRAQTPTPIPQASIAPAPVPESSSSSSTQAALVIFGVLFGLVIVGVVVWCRCCRTSQDDDGKRDSRVVQVTRGAPGPRGLRRIPGIPGMSVAPGFGIHDASEKEGPMGSTGPPGLQSQGGRGCQEWLGDGGMSGVRGEQRVHGLAHQGPHSPSEPRVVAERPSGRRPDATYVRSVSSSGSRAPGDRRTMSPVTSGASSGQQNKGQLSAGKSSPYLVKSSRDKPSSSLSSSSK